MKVALLAPYPVASLEAVPGTAESGHHATWLPRISRLLEDQPGLEIHWVTFTKACREPRVIEERGQRFHLLPRKSLALQMLTSFLSERRTLRRILEQIRPDLVHGWGTEDVYGYAVTDWPGPAVLSMQGILTACCRACPQPWLMRVQAWHERRVLRRVARLTVESGWGREQLRPLAPQAEISLLEYGVNEALFERIRRPDSQPLALFVGTLSRLKGVDILLEAFRDPRLADVRLVLLGDGPMRREAGSHGGNVHFLGHRPHEEVWDWMSRSWCLVHPSRADTSPNAVKEATSMGLPVIASRNGGQFRYVNPRSGRLLDELSVPALICAIEAVTRVLGEDDQIWRSQWRTQLSSATLRSDLCAVYGVPEIFALKDAGLFPK